MRRSYLFSMCFVLAGFLYLTPLKASDMAPMLEEMGRGAMDMMMGGSGAEEGYDDPEAMQGGGKHPNWKRGHNKEKNPNWQRGKREHWKQGHSQRGWKKRAHYRGDGQYWKHPERKYRRHHRSPDGRQWKNHGRYHGDKSWKPHNKYRDGRQWRHHNKHRYGRDWKGTHHKTRFGDRSKRRHMMSNDNKRRSYRSKGNREMFKSHRSGGHRNMRR